MSREADEIRRMRDKMRGSRGGGAASALPWAGRADSVSKEGPQNIEVYPLAAPKAASSSGAEAVDWSKLPGGKPLSQVLAEQQGQGRGDLVKDIFGVETGPKRRGSGPFGLKPFGAKKPGDAPRGDHGSVGVKDHGSVGVKWSEDVALNEREAGPRSPPARLDTAGSRSSSRPESRPESRQRETLMTDLDEEPLEGAQQQQQQQQQQDDETQSIGRRMNFSFGKKKGMELLADAGDGDATPQVANVQPAQVPISKAEPFSVRKKGGMRPF
jgi:hypothetical protein